MGFSYRCCFSCRFYGICSIRSNIAMHEGWDMWEIAEICVFYMPRKLNLLDKKVFKRNVMLLAEVLDPEEKQLIISKI